MPSPAGGEGNAAGAGAFPSPLAGEGGSRRLPDEGFYPRAICPLSQPLTPLNLWLACVMPSPARGEGIATGTASYILLLLLETVAASSASDFRRASLFGAVLFVHIDPAINKKADNGANFGEDVDWRPLICAA